MIDAVNESVDATRCQGQGDCHAGDTCLTHHLWCDLSQQIHEFLSGISLADLVTRREVQEVAQRQDQRRCEWQGAARWTRLKRPPSNDSQRAAAASQPDLGESP